jgi:hypothetical protein
MFGAFDIIKKMIVYKTHLEPSKIKEKIVDNL